MSGAVTLVAGVCGGAGASTLAAGLALASCGAGATWLIDLDHDRGDIAAGWDAPGGHTTRELLPVAGELTGAHLAQAARRHPSGVALLASPATPGAGVVWDAAAEGAIVGAAATGGDAVVVDCGARLRDAPAGGRTLLVCPPTLAGARRAVAAAARIGRDAGVLVRAGWPERGELSARSLERVTGLRVEGELPWSPGEARAIAAGALPSGRRDRLAAAIRALCGAGT